jgi:hypothetical protein
MCAVGGRGDWCQSRYLVDPECEAEQAGWIYEIRLAVERLARRQAAQRNGGEQGESAGGLPSPTKGAVDLEALAIHTGDSRGTMVKIEKAGWLFLAKPPSRRSHHACTYSPVTRTRLCLRARLCACVP